MFIIVDVGCIECGEQTEVRGIFETEELAKVGFDKVCKDLGCEKWEPRGGFLELLGLHDKTESTFIGGTGYFHGGQHALELHVFPPVQIKEDETPDGQ